MGQENKNNSAQKARSGSNAVRMIAALLAVGVLSGAVLVLVYKYATPKIEMNIQGEMKRAIEDIFPDAVKIEDAKDEKIFRIKDAGGKLLGYAFIAEGNGYQGTIKLMAGMDPGLSTLMGFDVLESQETPGLGAEICGKEFRGQFKGLSITHPIEYVKNKKPGKPYEIQAITGATISSRSVVSILNGEIEEVRKVLKGGK